MHLIHVKVSFKDPLLKLVGNIHGLGVVPDRSIHDGNALGTSVSPATSRRRSGEARDRASFSTRTHVVCPIEAFYENKDKSAQCS
jgi:hypothetical protein